MTVESRLALNSLLLLATVCVLCYAAWVMRGELDYLDERVKSLENVERARKAKRKQPAS